MSEESVIHLSREVKVTLDKTTDLQEKQSFSTVYDAQDSPHTTEISEAAAAGATRETGEEGLTGVRLYAMMTSITLAAFLMHLDGSILVTAIPKITTEFHSITAIGWYGAAYQLASASLRPLTGKLYASFPLKWTFISFVAVFELGSLLCATATRSDILSDLPFRELHLDFP